MACSQSWPKSNQTSLAHSSKAIEEASLILNLQQVEDMLPEESKDLD